MSLVPDNLLAALDSSLVDISGSLVLTAALIYMEYGKLDSLKMR